MQAGDTVGAGARIVGEALRLQVVRRVSHSRLTELWNNPVFTQKPPHWITTISARFGQWFTVGALALAALGFYAWWPDVRMAAQVATAVLIIACPCALTLAAPITLGTTLGTLGRAGVYLKQGAVALDLSRVDTIAFDKTGTLTTAEATATVDLDGLDERDWARVRRLAAESIHPVSRALAGRTAVEGARPGCSRRVGEGIRGVVDDATVALGSGVVRGARRGSADRPAGGRTWASVDGRVGSLASGHA